MTLKSAKISGLFKVTSSIVITLELRAQLNVLEDETFPFHWNTLMLWGSTHTDLDVMQEKNVLMIIGTSTEVCQIHGQDSQNSLYWKKHLRKDVCGPGRDWQKFRRQLDTRSCLAWSVVQNWKKPFREEKNKSGQLKRQNWTMFEVWEVFIPLIRTTRRKKTSSTMRGESWKGIWTPPCHAKRCWANQALRKPERKPQHPIRSKKRIVIVLWKLTNPQDKDMNLPYRKIMKITSQAKYRIQYQTTTWYTNSFGCLKRWKPWMQKQTRNGKSSKRFQPGSWIKSKARRRLFWRHRKTKRKSTLPHWGRSVI